MGKRKGGCGLAALVIIILLVIAGILAWKFFLKDVVSDIKAVISMGGDLSDMDIEDVVDKLPEGKDFEAKGDLVADPESKKYDSLEEIENSTSYNFNSDLLIPGEMITSVDHSDTGEKNYFLLQADFDGSTVFERIYIENAPYDRDKLESAIITIKFDFHGYTVYATYGENGITAVIFDEYVYCYNASNIKAIVGLLTN
ncbi:MAG: hypothetical protein KBS59_00870 [Clostridiales bacterium]|nr:hypothetical protein [Clostridiales bacterium]